MKKNGEGDGKKIAAPLTYADARTYMDLNIDGEAQTIIDAEL